MSESLQKLSRRVKQRQAMDLSIERWKDSRANSPNFSTGWQNFQCCVNWLSVDCAGCPIAEYTGRTHCESTPYRDIVLYQMSYNHMVRLAHLQPLPAHMSIDAAGILGKLNAAIDDEITLLELIRQHIEEK